MKTFIAVAVYNGKSNLVVPSRVYKVKASSKSVAAKRALAKAIADNPRYSSFAIITDTLTTAKIKAFNRNYKEYQDEIESLQFAHSINKKRLIRWIKRNIDWTIYTRAERDETPATRYCYDEIYMRPMIDRMHIIKSYENELATTEIIQLALLEIRDAINA